MAIPIDIRFELAGLAIRSGMCKTFLDIFNIIPKTVVAAKLGLNGVRFSQMIQYPEQFHLKEIYRMAQLMKIESNELLALICEQIDENTRKFSK